MRAVCVEWCHSHPPESARRADRRFPVQNKVSRFSLTQGCTEGKVPRNAPIPAIDPTETGTSPHYRSHRNTTA